MDLHLIIYRHTQKKKRKKKGDTKDRKNFMDWVRLATYGSIVTSGSTGSEPGK